MATIAIVCRNRSMIVQHGRKQSRAGQFLQLQFYGSWLFRKEPNPQKTASSLVWNNLGIMLKNKIEANIIFETLRNIGNFKDTFETLRNIGNFKDKFEILKIHLQSSRRNWSFKDTFETLKTHLKFQRHPHPAWSAASCWRSWREGWWGGVWCRSGWGWGWCWPRRGPSGSTPATWRAAAGRGCPSSFLKILTAMNYLIGFYCLF